MIDNITRAELPERTEIAETLTRRNGANGDETERSGWLVACRERDAGCKPASEWASVTVGASRLCTHGLVPAVALAHPTALRAVAPLRTQLFSWFPPFVLRCSVSPCERLRCLRLLRKASQ
jgi:hypothetical protein